MRKIFLFASIPHLVSLVFGDCYSLTNVTIPNGVESILEGAFRGCTSLASISVPEGTLLTNAFDENTAVTRR